MRECDLLIRNGTVFDGTGSGRITDIAITNGRVTGFGGTGEWRAAQEVDATGLWVTPGFVDIHTHYDIEVELAPGLAESVRHGVTSVVMGGCSLSAIYGKPNELADIFSRVETLPRKIVDRWAAKASQRDDAQQYFAELRRLNLGPNVSCILGHSALRVHVMGLERSLREHATAHELERMRMLAEHALEAGCIGISIDMVHWHKVDGEFVGRALPSHHAAYEEYAMLADVCRKRDAVFQVTPNPLRPASFADLLRLGVGIWRAPLRMTVLSALDMDAMPNVWRMFGPLLFLCNQILGCNIRFQTLAEPFTIFADGHVTPFFEEFSSGVRLNNEKTAEGRRELWRDPEFRKQFVEEWTNGYPRTFHRDLAKIVIVDAPARSLIRKTVAEAAGKGDPLEFFMQLLEEYDERFRWKGCSANARSGPRRELLRHPHILPGFSDAGAHMRNLGFFDNSLSVLREAMQSGCMTPERAIARVTSEPAAWFNLDAGTIAVGKRADINILDPARLLDPIPAPTFIAEQLLGGAPRVVKRDPRPAVRHVLVAGTEVVRGGTPLAVLGEQRVGRVLTQLNPARSAEEAMRRFRNRISDFAYATEVAEDYWTVFLLKHQHPGNVFLHCLAFLLMYFIPLFALCAGKLWVVALLPLSQVVGLVGHFVFERTPIDQRDTIFSWRAFKCLHMMFASVLVGRYWLAVARAREEWNYAENFNQ